MPTDTRPAATNAPAGDDDDDADDALEGGASGSGTAPAATKTDDDSDEDYRQRFLDERRERRRLARRLAEQKAQPPADNPDLQAQLTAANEKAAGLERDLHRERTYTRLTQEAARQGAVDPEVVANLLIASDDLDIGDDGRPSNAAEAVKDLLNTKPYLKGKPTPPTPRRGSGDAAAGRSNEPNNEDFNSAFRRLAAK